VRISVRGSGIGNASHNRGLLLAQDGVPFNEADGYGDSQIADPLLTRDRACGFGTSMGGLSADDFI
jgi:iron complex outermembrane receptor protein